MIEERTGEGAARENHLIPETIDLKRQYSGKTRVRADAPGTPGAQGGPRASHGGKAYGKRLGAQSNAGALQLKQPNGLANGAAARINALAAGAWLA